ncbi:unnamed protein product [Trichobilharzia szidati]|nr:unnamed protein product [Trichobilharzia szidati]
MPVTYNSRNPAVKRLMKEAQELSEPTELYFAKPLEDNLFEWHFTIRGPEESDFHGGIYHGRILLPSEYPMKPPNIVLLTPNGRFEINRKICLSISGYHPESWRPSWSIRTALLAIIGFMPTHGVGAIGSLNQTKEERQMLARMSQSYVCSTCGPIRNLLLPLTAASSSMNKEVSQAAAQISMMSEEETASKKASDKPSASKPNPVSGDSSTPSNKSSVNVNPPSKVISTTVPPSSATPSVSTSQGNISSPMGNVNPYIWPGISPYMYPAALSSPTSKITDTTTPQIAYWLCFPVYYPMPYPTNPNPSLSSATVQASSSSTVATNGERVPLSFSEWLKQIREKEKTKSTPTANTASDSSAVHSPQSHEGVSQTGSSSSVQSSIDRRFNDSPYSGSLQKSHEFDDHINSEVISTQKDDASSNMDLAHNKKNSEETTHPAFPTQQKNIEKVDSLSPENIVVHSPQNVQSSLYTDNLPHTHEPLNLSLHQSESKFVSSNVPSKSMTDDLLSDTVTKHSPTVPADDASKSESHLVQTVNPDTLLCMTSKNEIVSHSDTHLVEQKHVKVSETSFDSSGINGTITAGRSEPLPVNIETIDVNDKPQLDVSNDDLNKAKVDSTVDKDIAVKSLTNLIESLDNIDTCKKYREQKASNFYSGENETMGFPEKDMKSDQLMSGSSVDYQAGGLRNRIGVSPSSNPSLSEYTSSIYSINRRRPSLVPHDAATICAIGVAIALFVVVVRRLAIMFEDS